MPFRYWLILPVCVTAAFFLGMFSDFKTVQADHLGDEMHFVLGQQLMDELSSHTYPDGTPLIYATDSMPEIKIYYWSHLTPEHQAHITNYARQHGFDPEYHDEPHYRTTP